MKYKKRLRNLEAAKKWWDSLPQRDKDSTTDLVVLIRELHSHHDN